MSRPRSVGAAAMLAVAVLLATLAVISIAPGASATTVVDAQIAPTTTGAPLVESPNIIPTPHSGEEPEAATDPGGWAQYAVLGGIVVGLGVIVLGIRRDMRRSSTGAQKDP